MLKFINSFVKRNHQTVYLLCFTGDSCQMQSKACVRKTRNVLKQVVLILVLYITYFGVLNFLQQLLSLKSSPDMLLLHKLASKYYKSERYYDIDCAALLRSFADKYVVSQ